MNNPYNTMLSAQGAPVPAPTSVMDLPPALASILSVGSPSVPNNGAMNPAMGLSSGMGGVQTFVPSYQAGGMIGPGGMPVGGTQPGAPTSVGLQANVQPGGMSPQMLEMLVNQFASQHPQQIAQIRAAIQEVLATGELTQQELNMIVQLATVAAQNPEMYPYVRNFAIQQGIATEQDLPPQYDQGLVFVLLLAARALQQDVGGQPIPSMARGGMTPNSKKADGSVLINAHEGEYVIPANVVKMKGKEFFDSLVEKYKE